MAYHTTKFDEASRTFETRLLFIKELFTNKYSKTQIMASCVQHKLDRSFEAYISELHKSTWRLCGEDPMAILKRID